jgi:hypothetical protein
MGQGLENHRTLYIERQTDNGEHKIESFIFRLVTLLVSQGVISRNYDNSQYDGLILD